MTLLNSAEIGQEAKMLIGKRGKGCRQAYIQRQNDNCASVNSLDDLAKNVLAFNFSRKLEVLKGKDRQKGSRKAKLPVISLREYVGLLSYTS